MNSWQLFCEYFELSVQSAHGICFEMGLVRHLFITLWKLQFTKPDTFRHCKKAGNEIQIWL